MIVTDLNHIERQAPMTSSFTKAVDFLRGGELHDLPEGRVEIDGERVYAMAQRYETIADSTPKFEAHKRYIDIQYLVSGEEVIGWAPLGRMTITQAHDADKDVCFGTVPREQWTPVYLKAGELAVLWPEDGHAPKLANRAPSSVMKIVVKVAV